MIWHQETNQCEKSYWAVFVIGSWITGIALISLTVQWWYSSPLMITINADPISISEVPFPSFTICNMNKVMKSKVTYIEKELAKKNVSHLHHKYYLEEMLLVNEICLKHGKTHDEKEAGDLEFNSQELHEMLKDVRYYVLSIWFIRATRCPPFHTLFIWPFGRENVYSELGIE